MRYVIILVHRDIDYHRLSYILVDYEEKENNPRPRLPHILRARAERAQHTRTTPLSRLRLAYTGHCASRSGGATPGARCLIPAPPFPRMDKLRRRSTQALLLGKTWTFYPIQLVQSDSRRPIQYCFPQKHSSPMRSLVPV